MSAYVIESGDTTLSGQPAWPTSDTAWQIMYSRMAKQNGQGRFVHFLHGGSSGPFAPEFTQKTGESVLSAPIRETARILCDAGYVLLNSYHGGTYQTWGNDYSLNFLDEWTTYMFNTHPMTAGQTKLAIIGLSMGNVTGFNYTVRNQAIVAGMVGVVPSCSLEFQYNGGVEGAGLTGFFPNEINFAYGLPYGPPDSNNAPTLNATVKAQRDPLTRASELNGVIPYHIFNNTDDVIVDGATTVPAFATAVGATITNGTGNHFEWDIDNTVLLNFLNGLNWS